MTNVKQFSKLPKTSEDLHAPFTPQEIRDNEQVKAFVINNNEVPVKVWRFSPLGIEFTLSSKDIVYSKNSKINLKIFVGLDVSNIEGVVVEVVDYNGDSFYYVRLVAKDEQDYDTTDRRKSSRWLCSQQFYPTAVASNPAKFNDFIYFKIKDISYGGVRLITSLRNKFIVPGMRFDCLVNFPMVSQIKMNFKVSNISIELDSGREVLSIGATYDHSDRRISEVVGNYLFQFSNVQSAKDLKDEGFSVKSISEVVEYSFVRTKEEYDQVLNLRLLAYTQANKVSNTATPEDMADEYDSRARIVIGRYRGNIISCARLIYNDFEDLMEQEKYVKWPETLPRRDEMVEIMRACTHPDFRNTDLLVSLFKFIAISVMQSKREYIVICADDKMTNLYEKIGFQKVDLSYEHPKLNHTLHHILIANVPKAMAGINVNPIYWNIIWSDVTHYLEKHDLIEMDPLMKVRHFFYRLLKPLANYLFKKIKKTKVAKTDNKVERIKQIKKAG